MKSPEISRELGGYLLSRFHHLKVKVEQPEITITVEIREQGAYIHANQLPGAGGIPRRDRRTGHAAALRRY